MVAVQLVMWIFFLHTVAPEETCHFPRFLQSPPSAGEHKPWTTRMWWLYLRHAPKWAEKQDIYVKNGQMWRHREHNLQSCDRTARRFLHKSIPGHCSERQLVYNRTCIREEGYNTFRVIQYNADRTHRFTCMRFVQRGTNVVQVYEGPLSDTNDDDLCDNNGLRMDEWPWTAAGNDELTVCPVSGGFSFRTIRRLTNEDFCEDEWRRSQLEVECMRSDGMDFIAPKDSNCNPFLKHGDWKRLMCWAGWEHGDYIFMIASDVGSQPRYCLRFPKIQEGEFSVLVYFSVICPMENDGKPPHGIEYYELRMLRRDQQVCQDEDVEKCSQLVTTPEMCVKDKIYAPHCPKTCGRCATMKVTNIDGRRCWMDPSIHGNWHLYDRATSVIHVDIEKDKAMFSHLGAFQCLELEKRNITRLGQRYIMASLFDNGCSARYTCMEFIRRNNNVLQYRIGPSQREEMNMDDLCTFRDDPEPLSDFYRSFYFKNLILAKDLWPSYCGFKSAVPFNGTIGGRQCSGTVSDWDEETCTTRGTLVLKSDTCRELILQREFQCLAFIHDMRDGLQQLLITRSLDGRSTYNCWIVTSYSGGGLWPWKELYQVTTPQCSMNMDVKMLPQDTILASMRLDESKRSSDCKPERRNPPAGSHTDGSTSTTNEHYFIPNQDEAGDGVKTEILVATKPPKGPPTSNPPITDLHSTEIPAWGVFGRGAFIGCSTSIGKLSFVILLFALHLTSRTLNS